MNKIYFNEKTVFFLDILVFFIDSRLIDINLIILIQLKK